MRLTAVRRFAYLSFIATCAGSLVACGNGDDGDGAEDPGIGVRFSSTDPDGAPFPSDRHTVADASQISQRRVALAKPDCAVYVSDCVDIEVLNQLDGFSISPRFTVPFETDIDPTSVDSTSIFVVRVDQAGSERIGINQVVWDPPTKTLAFKSDQTLQESSRYMLVVTNGVRDARGQAIGLGPWLDRSTGLPLGPESPSDNGYRAQLRTALQALPAGGARPVAASLFSTQSVTADLVKINKSIKQSTPQPVDFMIGRSAGTAVRALFDVGSLQSIEFHQQTGTAPAYTDSNVRLSLLSVVPGSVRQVAYGQFKSPHYLVRGEYIPPTGSLSGTPTIQGEKSLLVQVVIPEGARPPNGWPTVIYGHGFGSNLHEGAVSSVLASQGLATVMINVVGHGGGELGTLNVQLTAGPVVVVPAGGRGIDQNGDGSIAATEGSTAAVPRGLLAANDGLRQTVVDLMQLVRQIETGVDVDGDGSVDLDGSRIYYTGQSFGGIYGTMLLGVEPSLKAGVPNVAGASLIEVTRLGSFRPFFRAPGLASRKPSLINLPPLPGVSAPFNLQFNENIPLRDQRPVVNDVPGAMAIAKFFDWNEWAAQSGSALGYARLIRKEPLAGSQPKPIIFQFAKGDVTMPNPTSSAIVRAGDFADRVSYFRNDLAYAANPAIQKNSHVYMTSVLDPAGRDHAVMAQRQIATFFASNGTSMIDPDGAEPFFETPIAGPLPEELNFIP